MAPTVRAAELQTTSQREDMMDAMMSSFTWHTSQEERVFEACWRAHELAEIMVYMKMWSPNNPPGVDMDALHARAQQLRRGLIFYKADLLGHLNEVIRYVASRMSACALEMLCATMGDALRPRIASIKGDCESDLDALFSNMTLQ